MTYEYTSDSDDEPLEYDSDSGDLGEESDLTADAASEEDEGLYCEDYLTLVRHLDPLLAEPEKTEIFYKIEPSVREKDGDLNQSENDLWAREKDSYQARVVLMGEEPREIEFDGIEHIAGPKCTEEYGYNGHNITFEEMNGCCNFQCLAHKGEDWESDDRYEPGDMDFEVEGEWFLTGMGDRFPSRDMDHPTVLPARHDWDYMEADNYQYVCYLHGSYISCRVLMYTID